MAEKYIDTQTPNANTLLFITTTSVKHGLGLEWIDINLILQPCGNYSRNVCYTVIENVGGGTCLIGGGGGGENARGYQGGYAPE